MSTGSRRNPTCSTCPSSTWWYTPTTASADLTGLQDLPPAQVRRQTRTTPLPGGRLRTELTLTNTGSTVALAIRAAVRRGASGPEVLPIAWSDNYVTLWPGESTTLRAEYRRSDLHGAQPQATIGHN